MNQAHNDPDAASWEKSVSGASGDLLQTDNQWHHKCINLDAQMDETIGTGIKYINGVIFHGNGNTPSMRFPFRIDDFTISTHPRTVQTRIPPPTDVTIEDLTVTEMQVGDGVINYNITATTEDCSQIPSIVIHPVDGVTANATLENSPQPLAGEIILKVEEAETRVSVRASNQEMKEALESLSTIEGDVQVSSQGNCRSQTWDIEWTGQPGDMNKLIEVDTMDVSGGLVDSTITKLTSGGLKFDTIPGYLLRQPALLPQVQVEVNKVPAKCIVQKATSSSTPVNASDAVQICRDNPGFQNGYGHDCESYAATWCDAGQARAGSEWTLGASYNHPENNCCACGKTSGSQSTQARPFAKFEEFQTTSSTCGFDYANGSTPVVHAVNVSSMTGGGALHISGIGFTGDLTVTVGNNLCRITWSSPSTIICSLSGTYLAGYGQAVTVLTGTGLAISTAVIDRQIAVYNVAPRSGSRKGGTELLMLGAGFFNQVLASTAHVSARIVFASNHALTLG